MKKKPFFWMPCLFLLLASCGGGGVSLYVTQDGTTLIVDSGRYERRPDLYVCGDAICVAPSARGSYVTGQVLVYADKANAQEVASLINRLGLSILSENDGSVYYLLVAVPTLFEEQWVQALKSQPLVSGAFPNALGYIDPALTTK